MSLLSLSLFSTLTIDRQAGCGAPGAVWVRVELAGVAGLVLRRHRLDGEHGPVQSPAQTDPLPEVLLHAVVTRLAVGGHGGGVALLGRLPPQNLLHLLVEGVAAGEAGRLPADGRRVAHRLHFTWRREEESAGLGLAGVQVQGQRVIKLQW